MKAEILTIYMDKIILYYKFDKLCINDILEIIFAFWN